MDLTRLRLTVPLAQRSRVAGLSRTFCVLAVEPRISSTDHVVTQRLARVQLARDTTQPIGVLA